MNIKVSRIVLSLLVVASVCSLSMGATLVVNQATGPYFTIQAAIGELAPVAGPNDIILVQGTYNYAGNLKFWPDVNGITLKAANAAPNQPTITVSGAVRDQNYIDIKAIRTTIDGFKINFSGIPWQSGTLDSNSTMVHGMGGASTVKNCIITGPGQANYRIRGIAGIAEVNNVTVLNCRIGILADLSYAQSNFNYSIVNSTFRNNYVRGVAFDDCNAVMDNCQVYSNGNTDSQYGGDNSGNIITQTRGSSTDPANGGTSGIAKVYIKNSIIRDTVRGRSFVLEDNGLVDINNCVIKNSFSDEILMRTGTLNVHNTIIRAGNGTDPTMGLACLNLTGDSARTGGQATLDHCTLIGQCAQPVPTQWAAYCIDPAGHIMVSNSIIIGTYGLHNPSGVLNAVQSDYTDNYAITQFAANGSVSPVNGAHDMNPKADPLFIQTATDSNTVTWCYLQPYSPCKAFDNSSPKSYIGAKPTKPGYEKWPADFAGTARGVDNYDYSVFASNWLKNNFYGTPADVNKLLGTHFEEYGSLPSTGNVYVGNFDHAYYQSAWLVGSSTVSLYIGTDANSGLGGTHNLRWAYNVNHPEDVNQVKYTDIIIRLPANQDLSKYDTMRIMVKRHSGNSSENDTPMYIKFLDDSLGFTPGVFDDADVVLTLAAGSTSSYPDLWNAMIVNMKIPNPIPAGFPWQNGATINNWKAIDGIVLGVRTQDHMPNPDGYPANLTGTIDIDSIQLSRRACDRVLGYPVGDLSQDCQVDFADVNQFVYFWLMGK